MHLIKSISIKFVLGELGVHPLDASCLMCWSMSCSTKSKKKGLSGKKYSGQTSIVNTSQISFYVVFKWTHKDWHWAALWQDCGFEAVCKEMLITFSAF